MSMGVEVVSTYLRSKMSSILEDAANDPGCPLDIVSQFQSLEQQIERSAPVPVDLLYELIEALSECRVFSYKRPTVAVSKKGFFYYLFRIYHSVSEFMFRIRMRNPLQKLKDKLKTPSPADSEAARAPAEAGLVIEETYPIQDHSLIIGFEKQVDQIEACLMPRPSTSNKEEEIEEKKDSRIVIGIVGGCGCGKTALAQKVFASPRIEEEFWPRIWVCLSNKEVDVDLNYILKEVGHELSELEGKRYLIVLDDAWQQFNNLGFPKGRGGAVIVTTRQEKVVTKMFGDDKQHVIRLEPRLSDDICWQIFSKQVQLHGKIPSTHPNLSTIKQLVKTNSQGQPLAAKTLANMLRNLLLKSNWIPAKDLCIAWGDNEGYWRWTSLPPPEEMEEVAELVGLGVCWLHIKGSLELNEMVFTTSYSAYLVFKLNDEDWYLGDTTTARVRIVSDEKCYQEGRRDLSFQKNMQGEEKGYFPQAGGTGWMEIKLGEFLTGDGRLVEVIIENTSGDWKKGLIIKGIHFRPNY